MDNDVIRVTLERAPRMLPGHPLPGAPTHTASAFLAGCLRRVSGDYQDLWGHPVLAVESFTDPALHRGTCYAAAGFPALGATSGYARTGGGSESYTLHGRPKTYWLKPLHRHALAMLAACGARKLAFGR